MKKLPIFSDEKPSELFAQHCSDSSSVAIDCEQCGRTLFDSSGDDMDEGELEDLLEKKNGAGPLQ